MRDLASRRTVNGQLSATSYGATPNNPLTWDYDKTQACLCDPGWEGHDCSLQSCVTGDDPMTAGVNETQVIKCTADGGSMQLGFRTVRGRTAYSDSVSHSATAAQLEAALEAMPTVREVEVVVWDTAANATGTEVCTATGANKVLITFVGNKGSLPALEPVTTSLTLTAGTATVQVVTDGASITEDSVTLTSVDGTTEDLACSNRGICNTATGVCDCFSGYTSSSSRNLPGDRGDCGAKRAVLRPPTTSTLTDEQIAILESVGL